MNTANNSTEKNKQESQTSTIETENKVWYKGEEYLLIESKNGITRLQDVTHDKETRTVEARFVMTDEEHQEKMKNTRSTHVKW